MIYIDHEWQDPYGSGGDTPSYNPVSKDYVPPNPAGSPVYHVNAPNGYVSIMCIYRNLLYLMEISCT